MKVVRQNDVEPPTLTGSFTFVSPTVYLALNTMLVSRAGSVTTASHSATLIPIIPTFRKAGLSPQKRNISFPPQNISQSILPRQIESDDNYAVCSMSFFEIYSNLQKRIESQGCLHANALRNGYLSDQESLSPEVFLALYDSYNQSTSNLIGLGDAVNSTTQDAYNFVLGMGGLSCESDSQESITTPFKLSFCHCSSFHSNFCMACMKADYRWSYDIYDLPQIKAAIVKTDPTLADCDLEENIVPAKVPRQLERSGSDVLRPLKPRAHNKEESGTSPSSISSITLFTRTLLPSNTQFTASPTPGSTGSAVYVRAIVPLATGAATVVEDGSGRKTVIIGSSSTTITEPITTFAGHKFRFDDTKDIVWVDETASQTLERKPTSEPNRGLDTDDGGQREGFGGGSIGPSPTAKSRVVTPESNETKTRTSLDGFPSMTSSNTTLSRERSQAKRSSGSEKVVLCASALLIGFGFFSLRL
jgi:hypothetical protein